MNEERINKLIDKGFKRWTKGNYDRLYINADKLGLEYVLYKTGNIFSATFKGRRISNNKASRMRHAKTYIDIKTEEIYSDIDILKEAVEDILNGGE